MTRGILRPLAAVLVLTAIASSNAFGQADFGLPPMAPPAEIEQELESQLPPAELPAGSGKLQVQTVGLFDFLHGGCHGCSCSCHQPVCAGCSGCSGCSLPLCSQPLCSGCMMPSCSGCSMPMCSMPMCSGCAMPGVMGLGAYPQAGYPGFGDYGGAALGGYGQPGGYAGQIGQPYFYSANSMGVVGGYGMSGMAVGMYGMPVNGVAMGGGGAGGLYGSHFGPGYYRSSEFGHYRYPYYSYRRPWYNPGPASFNRDTNLPW